MSDKDTALSLLFQIYGKIVKNNEELKNEIDSSIENVKSQFTNHPIGILAYINAVCRTDYEKDVYLENIKKLINEPFYKMNLSAHLRPIAGGMYCF